MRAFACLRALGLMVVTLLIVALTANGSPRAAPTITDARLEAYQLSGGLLSDLCADHTGSHAKMTDCWLCHFVAGNDLPKGTLSLIALDRQLVATVILPQLLLTRHLAHDPATPTRGPPATT